MATAAAGTARSGWCALRIYERLGTKAAATAKGSNGKPACRVYPGMKPLLLTVALFGMVIAAPQKSDAATVVHGARGTAVHTNYNWNDPYWRSHRYGYWNGQRGYWKVVNGRHVFVVVQ